MKKEREALYFSILINIMVAILKLVGGFFYGSYTLITDAYYTICDFITDIIALISAKISKRRANKRFPFGYGRIEYIAEMIIGFLIFAFGLWAIINSFNLTYSKPNLNIIYLIIFVIFLKALSCNYLNYVGKKTRSQILISASKESFLDVLSSIMVLFVVLVGQIFTFVDLIGSLFIAILILGFGIKIIIDNIFGLVGEDENDASIKKEIEKIINAHKILTYSDASLIKSGPYYQADIEVAVDQNMPVKDLIKMEMKLKKQIKKLKYNIKFIDFDFIVR